MIQTDVLIIGSGPPDAGLAAFLAQNGLEGLVIAAASSTAYTPRTHGFNPFAFECLRDIGLEDEALRLSIRGPSCLSMRFAHSVNGREYGRIQAWGGNPGVAAKVKRISPSEYCDLTQRHLEPLLVRFASQHGFHVRLSTELIAIVPGENHAAHRYPPAFGLGSNTCIQDAYNLAWKVAFVSKGVAGPSLLQTYSQERQPVGAALIRESKAQINANNALWSVLGLNASSAEIGLQQVSELDEATDAGRTRRAHLHEVLETKRQELESLGLAHNQWYISSAIHLGDEAEARPTLLGDPIVEVQVSTFPGSRLPHVWLDTPERGSMISTLDLAGKVRFCLLTGVGGGEWQRAIASIAEKHGIPIKAFGIGLGLEFMDVFRDWHKKRGVQENGCVLVRPDRFVAWRSTVLEQDCEQKLMAVLNQILFRHEL